VPPIKIMSRKIRFTNVFAKAVGFRLLAVLFISLFTGFQASVIMNVGLFCLYILYDILWAKLFNSTN
jgi:hypothetical protein